MRRRSLETQRGARGRDRRGPRSAPRAANRMPTICLAWLGLVGGRAARATAAGGTHGSFAENTISESIIERVDGLMNQPLEPLSYTFESVRMDFLDVRDDEDVRRWLYGQTLALIPPVGNASDEFTNLARLASFPNEPRDPLPYSRGRRAPRNNAHRHDHRSGDRLDFRTAV